jgi:hypothetical protein
MSHGTKTMYSYCQPIVYIYQVSAIIDCIGEGGVFFWQKQFCVNYHYATESFLPQTSTISLHVVFAGNVIFTANEGGETERRPKWCSG